jgi:hypothetical protein
MLFPANFHGADACVRTCCACHSPRGRLRTVTIAAPSDTLRLSLATPYRIAMRQSD